ncbi:hypothetical protein [Pseudomonas silesiensis]
MEANNYKRMAKNAGLLYFRMLLTMAVSLYTSRVVLSTLGVDDFGIYHLVGGFITMLGFLHGAMSSATQRFLSFELGKPDKNNLSSVFSMSINIHLLIAVAIFLLGETLGIWFITTQLTIPTERMEAARWVFHLSLLTFLVSVASVPYNAIIIAHERMSVFAWMSIIDVSLKLLIVFMLAWFGMDTLILYAALMLAVVAIVTLAYKLYCNSKFPESRFRFYWDKSLFNTMLSYTGWNIWGNIAAVMGNHGVNVMLNIFFGPAVNAARTIAFQVSAALNNFVQNLQSAINPQIIKSYAANDLSYMHKLVCYGAKYNFFLLLIISSPIIIATDLALETWLETVPPYTGSFVKLVIVNILIDSISLPLMTAAQATGKIKLYQTVVGGILLLNLPLAYIFLSAGHQPQSTLLISISLSIAGLGARLAIITPLIKLRSYEFMIRVIFRITIVALLSLLPALTIKSLLPDNSVNTFILMILSPLWVAVSIYLLGLGADEKSYLLDSTKRFVTRDKIKV